jgi:hypothetical protein
VQSGILVLLCEPSLKMGEFVPVFGYTFYHYYLHNFMFVLWTCVVLTIIMSFNYDPYYLKLSFNDAVIMSLNTPLMSTSFCGFNFRH